MVSLPVILKAAAVAIVAIVAAILGLRKQVKKESASQSSITATGKVADKQAAAIEEAGKDLAKNLASSAADRRAGVLRWLRNRPK